MDNPSSIPPEQNKALTVLGQFIGDIQQAMPETVKKNVLKAGNQLIFGMADIPLAWLEQFSKRIRRKTEAMDMIQQGENAAIVKLFEQDPTLAQETLNFNSLKEYKAFFNRQKVMQGAMDELKNNPPEEDTDQEIDEDWLDMFSRAVEAISQEDMQVIFSKILSGEIHKPGSFSRKTIQILSIIDSVTAKNFTVFCDCLIDLKTRTSTIGSLVIRQVFNDLVGTKYDERILSLQEAGLVHATIFHERIGEITIGRSNSTGMHAKMSRALRHGHLFERNRLEYCLLTSVGNELAQVLHQSTAAEAAARKSFHWFAEHFETSITID